jgi:hypothetical protein
MITAPHEPAGHEPAEQGQMPPRRGRPGP